MDEQVPEIMWQPDVEVHFLKQELKGKNLDLKDENDVEAFLATNPDLPEKKIARMRQMISRIKEKRITNERIKDKIVKITHDDQPNEKPKEKRG